MISLALKDSGRIVGGDTNTKKICTLLENCVNGQISLVRKAFQNVFNTFNQLFLVYTKLAVMTLLASRVLTTAKKFYLQWGLT